MSTNLPQNTDEQELDLSQISKKIGLFFDKINSLIFKGIQFFIKNALLILGLIVIGFGIGKFLDHNINSYDHHIIAQPNFGSTDYLYSKINLIQSKIIDKDTVFLKEVVGIRHPDKLDKIEIKPIIDVYQFVQNREKNFELIKLMAEDGDLNKILEDKLTSKNYSFHAISFATNELIDEKSMVEPLLKFLNDIEFYNKIQKEEVNNIKIKITQNDSIIGQIDGLINNISNRDNNSSRSDKLVYYNENTQLNDMIKTKEALISEQGKYRVELVSLDKVIKESSTSVNVKNSKKLNGKLKLVLPLILVLILICLRFFRAFYRKQSLLHQ